MRGNNTIVTYVYINGSQVEFLKKYPELKDFEFLQNKVPKIDTSTLQPAAW